jgi:origin recognition complex subunit 1
VFSSDIRRTLNVCRKAVEICQEEILKIKDFNQFKQITIDHISASYNLLYSTPYVECLKKFSRFQKVLLIALAIETKTQVTGRVSFCKVKKIF